MWNIIWNLVLLSVVIYGVAWLLPGVHIKNFGTVILVAVVYSVINFLLYKILFWLSIPFVIITFGLFTLVINAFLLWITDKILNDFKIDSIGWTVVAAVLITLGNGLLHWIF